MDEQQIFDDEITRTIRDLYRIAYRADMDDARSAGTAVRSVVEYVGQTMTIQAAVVGTWTNRARVTPDARTILIANSGDNGIEVLNALVPPQWVAPFEAVY